MNNALKVLLLLMLGVALIGFGLCGGAGIAIGVVGALGRGNDAGASLVFILPGAVGLGVAWALWISIRALLKTMKDPQDPPQ
jgi:uncharacterized membrane protein YqjE